MFGSVKRFVTGLAAAIALSGCAVIPDTGMVRPETSAPAPSASEPVAGTAMLPPQEEGRHRVALLLPLTGDNGEVGQSIANATTMALLDTEAQNLRITTYDVADGAAAAARRAIADGNRLILGPLQRSNIGDVLAVARPSNVPLITFSNDTSAARADVFVMGHVPEQSVARTIAFAMEQGARRFAVLAPRGDYGNRATVAAEREVQARGGRMVDVQRYDRGNTSIISAAERLRAAGGFDTVLIADNGRFAAMAAPRLKPAGASLPSIIGTELWSRERSLLDEPSLRGAWFSAVSDDRYRQFAMSYESRFGAQPYRIATLGYDAVLLTLRLTRDWVPGRDLPAGLLTDEGGFLGLDGAIRFREDGVGERVMEVRQIGNGAFTVVSPAPAGF